MRSCGFKSHLRSTKGLSGNRQPLFIEFQSAIRYNVIKEISDKMEVIC